MPQSHAEKSPSDVLKGLIDELMGLVLNSDGR